jgi:hypothetical protein
MFKTKGKIAYHFWLDLEGDWAAASAEIALKVLYWGNKSWNGLVLDIECIKIL